MTCDLCQLLDGFANKQGCEALLWRSERLSVVAVDDRLLALDRDGTVTAVMTGSMVRCDCA